MGNSCSSFKLYLEKKVAGSITKRTLAKDAKPITKDGQPEPPELASIHDSWDALLANHLRPAGEPVSGVKFAAVSYVELAAEAGFAALVTVDDAKKPMLSRIFLWYAGDFESRGGSPQYAARYAPPGAAKDALATTSPSYFAYDWHLNTQ